MTVKITDFGATVQSRLALGTWMVSVEPSGSATSVRSRFFKVGLRKTRSTSKKVDSSSEGGP